MKEKLLKNLRTELMEIFHLGHAFNLMSWDEQTYLPKKASDTHARTRSFLSGQIHQRLVKLDHAGNLTKLKKLLDSGKLNEDETVIVREVWREYDRQKKLPTKFVEEYSAVTSKATEVWKEARTKSDFALFAPHMEKIVQLARKEARLVGFGKSPYNALLDVYEPGLTTVQLDKIFGELKTFLIDFLMQIKKSKIKVNKKILYGNFPILEQKEFNEEVIAALGFNFEAGRLNTATHPTSMGMHPYDVRLTTRYDIKNILYSLFPTIHEAGHGIYSQGLPFEYLGTPLGQDNSTALHESQSRMWENLVGKSLPFWKFWYPKLQKRLPRPFKQISLEKFYYAINNVDPTFIRTESDEVTYSLHIILRYEIEKELIEGKLAVQDLPKMWNQKMKDYFAISVSNDTEGVLQDVHWSFGLFGYFPTYALGNLYSAQIFAAAKEQIPNLEKEIAKGNFSILREWLRIHIHSTGKRFNGDQLVTKISGESLQARYYIDYLQKKYKSIYHI